MTDLDNLDVNLGIEYFLIEKYKKYFHRYLFQLLMIILVGINWKFIIVSFLGLYFLFKDLFLSFYHSLIMMFALSLSFAISNPIISFLVYLLFYGLFGFHFYIKESDVYA